MEETENKIPKTITLDPVAVHWVGQKAAEAKQKGVRQANGRPPSDSWVIETLVIEAMKKDAKQTTVKK